MAVTGSVKDNVISDDRIAALTDNGMFFTKAGTAGDESINNLTVSGNDFSRWTPVEAVVDRNVIIDWTAGVLCNQSCHIFNNKRTRTEDPVFVVDTAYASGTAATDRVITCGFLLGLSALLVGSLLIRWRLLILYLRFIKDQTQRQTKMFLRLLLSGKLGTGLMLLLIFQAVY